MGTLTVPPIHAQKIRLHRRKFHHAFARRGGLRRTSRSCRRRCVGGSKSAFDATRTFRSLARFPRMNFFELERSSRAFSKIFLTWGGTCRTFALLEGKRST